ncbi:MAG: hypothetical protein AAGL17_22195, partial [Cyanobacteria bacterium J06576_12]
LATVLSHQSTAGLNDISESREESEEFVSSLFKASDYAPSDPFAPPENIPGYDQATYQQLNQLAVEQQRALEVGEKVAQNHVRVERIEGLYTDAALIQAQTRVKQEHITNEGLKLQQAIQAGKLITTKTEGIAIETSMQKTRNLTASNLVEIEAMKGQALIEGATLQVEGIRADNNALLMASQKDFESMRGAGVNGSYSSY